MQKAFEAAFEKWWSEYRDDPEAFMAREEFDSKPLETIAESSARLFVSYLNELAAGRPWDQIGS